MPLAPWLSELCVQQMSWPISHHMPPPLDPACVVALRSIDEDSGTAQTHLLASHPHSHQTHSNDTIYCILTVLGDPMITLTKAFTCTDVM